MKYRKLRIAWSVAWGVLALLLVVLWGLGFYYRYALLGRTNSQLISASSQGGQFRFFLLTPTTGTTTDIWQELPGDRWFAFRYRANSETRSAAEWKSARGDAGFGWRHDAYGAVIYIPQWFTLLLSAVMAVAPWIKWRWRFSLRMLLVGMTVAAIGLGWIVYTLKQ